MGVRVRPECLEGVRKRQKALYNSQKALKEKARVGQDAVSKFLTSKEISRENFDKICDALEYSAEEITELIEVVDNFQPSQTKDQSDTNQLEKIVTYKNAPLVLAAYRHGAIPDRIADRQFVGRDEAINPEPAKRHYREDLSNKPKQNLLRHENEFIGRHRELCKLMKYLSPDKSVSIIAIDGIAGVGKTALALEAAWLCLEYREYAEESPNYSRRSNSECNIPLFDAIIFTSAKENKLSYDGIIQNLAGQRTLQEIYRTISETLDTPAILESHQQEQFNQVIKSLKQQKTLLIIDNLETIHREERERVMSFLHDLPMGVKALITTREQLGYTPIRLSSLEEIDAKALIKQQLQEKGIRLTGNEIHQLYKACDGVPLAIIYTIGRLSRSSSLKTVLDELLHANIEDSDLALFCFSKSIQDLQQHYPLAYWLLLSIATFQNPPLQEAIIAVAGFHDKSEFSISRSLDRLQQISLVRYDSKKSRYKMTALTREYALSELQKHHEFKQAAYQRLSEWYMNFARKNHNVKDRFVTGYEHIRQEWQDLLAVLRWHKDQGNYESIQTLWFYLNNYANLRGNWIDRLFWLDWIAKESEKRGEIKIAIKARIRRARINLLIGEYHQAEKELLASWAIRKYADPSDIDYLTNHLAGLYLRLENYQEAHKWLDEEQRFLDQNKLSKNEKLLCQIYIDRERAELFLSEKKYQESKDLCEKVINQCKLIGNKRNQNYAKRLLAEIAINQGDLDTAEQLLNIGFREVNSNHDKRRIACYQFSYVQLENAKGDRESDINKAQEYFKSAERYATQAYSNFINLGMKAEAKKVRAFTHFVREKILKETD